MVALECDKFMKGIMVAAGATLDGGVWVPHFVPSSVKMASPEHHGLLAHHYIPKATARFAGQVKNEMEMKIVVYTAWTQVDQNAVKRSIASWPKRLLYASKKRAAASNTPA